MDGAVFQDHIGMRHLIFPHVIQFPDRLLVQPSVFHRKLSRKAHLSEPFLIGRVGHTGVPVLHPAHHDPASVRSQHGLGSIKVNPIINGLLLLLRKCERLPVIFSDQAERSVSVVKFKALGQHILGAGQQHPFAVQFKEIRTLPHFSDPVPVFRKYLFILPSERVLAGEKQDLPASVRRAVSDHTPVPSVLVLPHLRIPEILSAEPFWQIPAVKDRVAVTFLIIHTVPHRNALCLYITVPAVPLGCPYHSGIHQKLPAVGKFDCAAGKTAVPVISLIRRQRGGQVVPVQQIRAHRMPPVHGTPFGIIRVILIEHVIPAFIIRKSVGVIHPAGTDR